MLTTFRTAPIRVALVLLGALLVAACGGGGNSGGGGNTSSDGSNAPDIPSGNVPPVLPLPPVSPASPLPSITAFSLSPSTPVANQRLTLTATVRCLSSDSCSSTTLAFRRDEITPIISSDTLVSTINVPALSSGQTRTFSINPTAVADQYYGACIGSMCRHSTTRIEGNAPPVQPGGVATRDVWSLTEASDNGGTTWSDGEIVDLTVTIRCDADTCSSRDVEFYISHNNVISTSDLNIGSVRLSSLSRGQTQTLTGTDYTVRYDVLESNGIGIGTALFYWGICVTSNQCF